MTGDLQHDRREAEKNHGWLAAAHEPRVNFRHKKTSTRLVDVLLFYCVKTLKLAERTGLEPATPGVTGRYSNRLNYRSALE